MISKTKDGRRPVIFGDSALDIETGKNAGTLTCAVTYGLGEADALRDARPDFVIDGLAGLKHLFH